MRVLKIIFFSSNEAFTSGGFYNESDPFICSEIRLLYFCDSKEIINLLSFFSRNNTKD